jgi:hypothetical protein
VDEAKCHLYLSERKAPNQLPFRTRNFAKVNLALLFALRIRHLYLVFVRRALLVVRPPGAAYLFRRLFPGCPWGSVFITRFMDAVEKANAERQKRWCVRPSFPLITNKQKPSESDVMMARMNQKGEGPKSRRGNVCGRVSRSVLFHPPLLLVDARGERIHTH